MPPTTSTPMYTHTSSRPLLGPPLAAGEGPSAAVDRAVIVIVVIVVTVITVIIVIIVIIVIYMKVITVIYIFPPPGRLGRDGGGEITVVVLINVLV